MPGETRADLDALGRYATARFEQLAHRTGRELIMEVGPGTMLVAGSGYLITRVLDRKTGPAPRSMEFVVVDGGMDCNARPQLYGSAHPFSVVSGDGRLLSAEGSGQPGRPMSVVGVCCETGDCHTLAPDGSVSPRMMADPSPGDLFVVGGVGAYCSAMAPFNYNSRLQAPEVLIASDGSLHLIRRRQSLLQLIENERPLPIASARALERSIGTPAHGVRC